MLPRPDFAADADALAAAAPTDLLHDALLASVSRSFARCSINSLDLPSTYGHRQTHKRARLSYDKQQLLKIHDDLQLHKGRATEGERTGKRERERAVRRRTRAKKEAVKKREKRGSRLCFERAPRERLLLFLPLFTCVCVSVCVCMMQQRLPSSGGRCCCSRRRRRFSRRFSSYKTLIHLKWFSFFSAFISRSLFAP